MKPRIQILDSPKVWKHRIVLGKHKSRWFRFETIAELTVAGITYCHATTACATNLIPPECIYTVNNTVVPRLVTTFFKRKPK